MYGDRICNESIRQQRTRDGELMEAIDGDNLSQRCQWYMRVQRSRRRGRGFDLPTNDFKNMCTFTLPLRQKI